MADAAAPVEDRFIEEAKKAAARFEARQSGEPDPAAPADDRFVQAAKDALRRFEAAHGPAPTVASAPRREVPVDVLDEAARDQVRVIGYLGRSAAPLPLPGAPQSTTYSSRTLGGAR